MDHLTGGQQVVGAARAAGVDTLFTLSGAHLFPVYDAAVGGRVEVERAGDPRSAASGGPLRLVDVRHEQTAVFAAEAMGKLTRTPGFAAVTAGPGVTNAVSAVASARFNGSPLVVLGGRAPDMRWGSGALQELDHPPILAPVTKAAWTTHDPQGIRADADRAFALAASAHMGPVFWDLPMDVMMGSSPRGTADAPPPDPGPAPDPDAVDRARALLDAARRPVLVLGSGVWLGDAVEQACALAHERGLPVVANGMGRGVLAPGDANLVTRARGAAFAGADLVVVVGAPLDFRLGFGVFGSPGAPVVHLVDADDQVSDASTVACTIVGELAASLAGLVGGPPAAAEWRESLAALVRQSRERDVPLLTSAADPIHPARIYGELLPRLSQDAVVIGDGGDFVSFAGTYIEPARPGRWLDPGPFGCLGTGPGYALAAGIAHPGSPIVLLLGDGAAGFSLMDVDSLVRHRIPVVMIVGNNSGWGLEKHPMRMMYGYDVIADLEPTRYDSVVTALGGAGETVERADQVGPAIDRAMAAGVPYLVNVLTDPEAAYPRRTLGI